MTAHQRQILDALKHGPLGLFELADQIDSEAFRVRAELHALRRERIVHERLTRTAHIWELTNRGQELAWAADQLTL